MAKSKDKDNNDLAGGHELEHMKDDWWWFFLLGIALVILGTFAIGSAVFVSVAAVVLFGFLLLAGGIVQIVSSFWAGDWSGRLLHLLIGILYIVVGLMIVDAPEGALAAITLMMAAFFVVSGLFRIVAAMSVKFHDWGWALLSGIVSVLLGLLIYRGWPATGAWIIGLYIGIEMIFNGWWWIMLSWGLKKLTDEATD